MPSALKKTLSILIILLLGFVSFKESQISFAQTTSTTTVNSGPEGYATMGVAKVYATKLKNIQNGSIVSLSHQGAILSDTPYDSQVIGVVSRDAAILISNTNSPNSVPVISDGVVYLLVSTQQGNISPGDLLTTSTIPGVAVKADKSGYVLGSALESYSNPNPNTPDLIAAELNLHYFNTKPTFLGSLTDILKLALLPTNTSPSPIWKYIVAAAVVLASFILAFMTFGRTAAKGIEALGRNPSAGRIIHLGIIFNVAIVVVIVLAGLTVAFLILRL
jgi:F0F1-type ATP synthase membrane subunit c/vacuolar-type H+-ATPase subunit K